MVYNLNTTGWLSEDGLFQSDIVGQYWYQVYKLERSLSLANAVICKLSRLPISSWCMYSMCERII